MAPDTLSVILQRLQAAAGIPGQLTYTGLRRVTTLKLYFVGRPVLGS